MPPAPSDTLSIYVLNVGQCDTQVIRTPEGKLIVVDAVKPAKLKAFLRALGLASGEEIHALVLTHPHLDHYSAANGLMNEFDIHSICLAPFWHHEGWGANTYRTIVNRIESQHIPVQFISGYNRIYPDDMIVMTDADGDGDVDDAQARGAVPYLEVLGPPNSLVHPLEGQPGYDINHLSMMVRVVWNDFAMVLAGDAQMENWAAFDREGMLGGGCRALSAAHHGSKRGTQWERLERLAPEVVVVSSDPWATHDIPDAIGCAIFREYAALRLGGGRRPLVAMTSSTGSIEIEVSAGGRHATFMYGDKDYKDDVDLATRAPLTAANNPTDWDEELRGKLSMLLP